MISKLDLSLLTSFDHHIASIIRSKLLVDLDLGFVLIETWQLVVNKKTIVLNLQTATMFTTKETYPFHFRYS